MRRSLTCLLVVACGAGAACDFGAKGHDWPGAGECGDDGLDDLRHALREVCSGVGDPAAGMPAAPGAIRKTVLLSAPELPRIAILAEGKEEWHRWSSCVPAAWAPAAVADAELVACVGRQGPEPFASCGYTLTNLEIHEIKRTATVLPVSLRDARTGAAVGATTLRHDPPACPADPDSGDELVGASIEYRDVEAWLDPLLRRGP